MNVTAVRNQIPCVVENSQRKSSRDQIIRQIAVKTFAEFAVSFLLATVVCCFVTTPMGIATVFTALAIQTACHFFLRVVQARKANSLTPIGFTYFSGTNFQTLTHEMGHALAANAVYASGNPRIELFPFNGGVTGYHPQKLTPFGQKLGKTGSAFFVAAAGARLTLIISALILSLGLILRKKCPTLAEYFISYAAWDFFYHAFYAASALSPIQQGNLTHDFVYLSKLGLSPLHSAIGLLAFPILLTVNLSLLQRSPKRPRFI
ncbi:MAG TPA: hypothetical protein VLE89_04490 [Chlamydiales bacterium]|nr:hypothetical protein [Chlamydiales bacterium]